MPRRRKQQAADDDDLDFTLDDAEAAASRGRDHPGVAALSAERQVPVA
jgi:hypothetical protein